MGDIKKIENYFDSEINQRKLCSKKLSKYVSTFNYIDKILIVLNATAGGVCIISHATVVGALIYIYSCIVYQSNKSRFLKQKTQQKQNNSTLY